MNDTSYSAEQMAELINLTTERLGLQEPYVIEKDLYVTKAISVLMAVPDDTFKLVFQGGTALAKAHNYIERMSEDCDFRLAYKVPSEHRKKDAQRKLLRSFRKNLLAALSENGFELAEDAVRVRNEGQFISVRARYASVYDTPMSLKPYLALEFFLGQVKTPTVERTVTSLIRQTLGEKIAHPEVPVHCISIPETAAEKWVALTRRVATMEQRKHYYDQALVRHIYDLTIINQNQPLKETSFAKLVGEIVEGDRQHFKTHSDVYHQDPIKAVQHALHELEHNPMWRENWENFMGTMVYGDKPTYEDAMKVLKSISAVALCEV